MTCKWVASDQPRVLTGRHDEDCTDEGCRGCQPCNERHCAICGRSHVDQITCAGCISHTREDLREVVVLSHAMPDEAATAGIESEAFHLTGPTANPEAWRQRGRYGHKYDHDTRLGEDHQLWVLGTWDLAVTEHYGHTRTAAITETSAADYLGRNLTDLAQDPDFAFEDLASDLRRCRSHLEAVLHDQRQGDRANIACFDCGGTLERRIGTHGFEDVWTCCKCKRRYTWAAYNFALRAKLEEAIADEASA